MGFWEGQKGVQSAVQDGLWVARIWKAIAESCIGRALGRQDREWYFIKLSRAGHRLPGHGEVP